MGKFEAGMEGMVDAFVFETSELLEKLDEILIRTEQEETLADISEDDIGEIFRVMHTIKGSAAMMGLHSTSKLAHAVEDLFYLIRENTYVNQDKKRLYELLFKAADSLKGEVENLEDESVPLSDFTDQIDEIHKLADFMKGAGEESSAGGAAAFPEGIFGDDEPGDMYTYRVIYSESCAMPSARAMVLLRKLGVVAEVCRTVPEDIDADNADDSIKQFGLFIKLITDDTAAVEKMLKSGINVESFSLFTREEYEKAKAPKSAPAPKAPEPAKEAPKAETAQGDKKPAPKKEAPKPAQKHESSMLTVKLEKLDRLLDLVSEIVITEGGVVSSPDLKGFEGNMDRFNKSARELRKLTDELQDAVMSLRMVTVSTAFQKMNRVIRDMNSTLGKNVTLEFVGQETEVDKAIVDILGDPLMHIVRNAVDHGIEMPDERAAAGKTEPPTVTLSACYDSGEVVISCTDNGAGMDAAKIMAKAKKNGLLTKPENEYTEEEIFNFVVMAGFSTNEQVTQYSGRGVGMDVVKKNIEKVGGKLLVHSVFGQGSTFEIRIPLSLSIVDVLNIEVGSDQLSIPSGSIREAFSCDEESYVCDPEGNEFVYLRGMCLPLIRLSRILKIPGEAQKVSDGICIYCFDGDNEAVLLADRMVDDQQVVVRPFSPLLDSLELKKAGMAGCSIMGDGSIIISLDVGEILKKKKGGAKNG